MAERWALDRAGITNVYQYGEEVLSFGGGRLLLRGVNGSGKSTAMNMLLPFLLEADVRRIDAAGEQTGVLRSWMLAGRDETQPTGYLWLGLRRGDEHLTFGCGIKANRNTDNVNHWWFVTDRRPGVDLDLVRGTTPANRTPLSAEALRAELGEGHVWGRDQRAGYRARLREVLYGGADIDQHLRLLHVVRNPRVGDRVDVDLPQHLHDALPQLSDSAVDDAASPLEQLEEHRSNVTHLTATVAALDALTATYRDHVRGELRARTAQARSQVSAQARTVAAADEADRAATEAVAEARRVAAEVTHLDGRRAEQQRELETLKASDAYRSVGELGRRRDEVARLATQSAEADTLARRAEEDRSRAAADVGTAERSTDEARRHIADDLAELATAAATGLRRAPTLVVPEVPAAPLTHGTEVVAIPSGPLSAGPIGEALRTVRAEARVRGDEVGEARTALDRVDAALEALGRAERAVADARVRRDEARAEQADAAGDRHRTAEAWRAAATGWVDALRAHHRATGAPSVPLPDLAAVDVVDQHPSLHEGLAAVADEAVVDQVRAEAAVTARLGAERLARDESAAVVDELAGRTLPDAPSAPWQAERTGPSLAELIDFRDELDDTDRAGLEAALEASGLLAAEVRPDGAVIAVGDLVLAPSTPVDAPLTDLLTVVVPEQHRDRVPAETVTAVLAGISTRPPDPADGERPAVMVAVDGSFRLGPLAGRHTKAAAALVGLTARRAALDRMRADAAAALAAAEAVVAATEAEQAVVAGWRAAAEELRRSVPTVVAVATAVARHDRAVVAVTAAEERIAVADEARRTAESAHAERSDDARRRCATLALPADRAGLDRVAEVCRGLPGLVTSAERSVGALAAAVARWVRAGERWSDRAQAAAQAAERAARSRTEHSEARAELVTLEDAIGLDVADLLATVQSTQDELTATTERLKAVRALDGPAQARSGTTAEAARSAAERREAGEARSVAVLGRLRRAVAVPGLLAAAIGPDPTSDADQASPEAGPVGGPEPLPVVPDSTVGLRALARAVEAAVPAPASEVSADSVRGALMARRATLGAGWDATTLQPDPLVPLRVEVNGPLGRMALVDASARASDELATTSALLSSEQDQALRNLLQGLIAKEVAEKLHAARELVARMNDRLGSVRTAHGIGVSLRWERRDDLGPGLGQMADLLARPADLRTPEEDQVLVAALSGRIEDARRAEPEAGYRQLVARVLDYRDWHRMKVVVHRTGESPTVLGRRTALSEGEKKMVSYQPLFAAVAASCDALAEREPAAPRFVLLDDAFAKVSEDNHPKLFGLLVDLDLDFIATSERLRGTHATVPELAITEVLRDADAGVIVLEHAHWDGRTTTERP